MKLEALNGLFLTQSEDVPFEDRLFLKEVRLTSVMEASAWKEITGQEKEQMEAQNTFFSVDKVDMNYLRKMDNVLVKVADKVNLASLTHDEALEMKKYYPKWEDIIGKDVYTGFYFVCDDILFEVVTPHTVKEEMKPTMQVMTLNLLPEEEMPAAPVYYKMVEPTAKDTMDQSQPSTDESQLGGPESTGVETNQPTGQEIPSETAADSQDMTGTEEIPTDKGSSEVGEKSPVEQPQESLS